jgi:tetratricopeptide (TPR) repeat protein
VADAIPKYRAFLSYSHRDTAWAKWLHKALEGYRIDKDIVGRATPVGPVPKTLRPIFRDREDFAAGHSLTEQTIGALETSQFVVVLCSPAAAKSPYVNEEIRYFKSLGRADRVIPVIIEGEPGDPERDCFPPALRFKLGRDGELTDQPEEPIAADARAHGDGREIAKLKLVAGLLGVGLDEIERRAERARRRRTRMWGAIAATFVLLAVAATGSAAYAWQQLKTNEAFLDSTLKTATEIVDTAVNQAERYNVPRTATFELLSRAERLFDEMSRLGRPTPELRYRKAWMLIIFARGYETLGQSDKQLERATEAHRLLAALAAEKPNETDYQRELAVALGEVGNVMLNRGKLAEALQAHRDSLAIKSRLTQRAPYAHAWRDEMVSWINVGDILVLQGQLAEALTFYNHGLGICRGLVQADANNKIWQSDLAAILQHVGDVVVLQGKAQDALQSYREGLSISERLAKAEPDSWSRQRSMMVAHSKIGEALRALKELGPAAVSFANALEIAERLARADPLDAKAQYDLATSHERLGVAFQEQQKYEEALIQFKSGRDLFQKLVTMDPRHTNWRRGLASAHLRIGNILEAKKEWPEALQAYGVSFDHLQRLLATDPNHTGWQHDVMVVHARVGEVLTAQKQLTAALKSLQEALTIIDRLTKTDPSNARWQQDVSNVIGSFSNLSYQFLLARNFPLALETADLTTERMPDALWLQVNRAHALLFIGRVDEARALYIRHRGAADVNNGKSWEEVVREDFQELRQAGLVHPLMDELEKLFAPTG